MPYLQLDTPGPHPVALKRQLAETMCRTYADMMSVDIRRITVAVREIGEGGLWRMPDAAAGAVPVSLMMLNIRAGRPPELRLALAQALCAHCIELLGLREDRLNVEFTQHTGDEMVHPTLGGFSPDWRPGEGGAPA